MTFHSYLRGIRRCTEEAAAEVATHTKTHHPSLYGCKIVVATEYSQYSVFLPCCIAALVKATSATQPPVHSSYSMCAFYTPDRFVCESETRPRS